MSFRPSLIAREMTLICWHYNHTFGRLVRQISHLNCHSFTHDPANNLPVIQIHHNGRIHSALMSFQVCHSSGPRLIRVLRVKTLINQTIGNVMAMLTLCRGLVSLRLNQLPDTITANLKAFFAKFLYH